MRATTGYARILGIVDILFGLAYVFGPDRWSSGGNFTILRQLLPVPAVAVLIATAGVLVLFEARRAGYALGVIALGYWGLCTAATLPTTATGGGGPVLVLGWAALHVMGLYVRTQTHTQERRNREDGDG